MRVHGTRVAGGGRDSADLLRCGKRRCGQVRALRLCLLLEILPKLLNHHPVPRIEPAVAALGAHLGAGFRGDRDRVKLLYGEVAFLADFFRHGYCLTLSIP